MCNTGVVHAIDTVLSPPDLDLDELCNDGTTTTTSTTTSSSSTTTSTTASKSAKAAQKIWGKWEELGFITWRRKGRGRYEAEVAGKHDPLIIKVLILPHLRNEDSEGRWMVEDLKI